MPAHPAACAGCGTAVGPGEGFRLRSAGGNAAFCRLEHAVRWVLRGARAPADPPEVPEADHEPACAWCAAELADDEVVLVSHRGEHRIADGFCSLDHLRAWAGAGGRWRP